MSKKMPVIEVIGLILTSCYPKKKKSSHYLPPHGMWLAYGYGRSQKISATTPPPPTESARPTAIPENFCYYPPPTESGRPPEITENWPPPKKNPGYAVGRDDVTTRMDDAASHIGDVATHADDDMNRTDDPHDDVDDMEMVETTSTDDEFESAWREESDDSADEDP